MPCESWPLLIEIAADWSCQLRRVMGLVEQFFANDNHVGWGVNSQLYPVAFHAQYPNLDDLIEDDCLTCFAT
jgi:hypothetical protein